MGKPKTPPRLDAIHLGDCGPGMAKLKKESIDIVSTDPPYVADLWEVCYEVLAKGVMRALKPGGFCLTYTPQRHYVEIMDIMRAAGLTFYWPIPELTLGRSTAMVHDRNAICLHKPIIAWCKLREDDTMPVTPKPFTDVVQGYRQKAFHPWQQSVHVQLGLISRFARPGELLMDPYAGTGTACLAAKLLGMHYMGWEIDPVTHAKALDRMGQAPITMETFLRKSRGKP
jgi:adenine-specific DNA-methyltransferase